MQILFEQEIFCGEKTFGFYFVMKISNRGKSRITVVLIISVVSVAVFSVGHPVFFKPRAV
jgi:hypothetical protein